MLAARRRPRAGAAGGEPGAGRRREPLPGGRRADRGRAARHRSRAAAAAGADRQRLRRDAPRVPSTLRDAAELFAASEVAAEAFGKDVVDHYGNAARVELDGVRRGRDRLGATTRVRALCDAADRHHRVRRGGGIRGLEARGRAAPPQLPRRGARGGRPPGAAGAAGRDGRQSSNGSTASCSRAARMSTRPATAPRPPPRTGAPRTERDATELAVLARALELGLPVLAVCRGLQVLNVALGGTLVQHLPDDVGHAGHNPRPGVFGRTAIALDPGSRVAAALGSSIVGQCHHHQAIDRLAEGLVVTGRAPDGTVEAVELADHPFVVGVQWHPEQDDPPDLRRPRGGCVEWRCSEPVRGPHGRGHRRRQRHRPRDRATARGRGRARGRRRRRRRRRGSRRQGGRRALRAHRRHRRGRRRGPVRRGRRHVRLAWTSRSTTPGSPRPRTTRSSPPAWTPGGGCRRST